MPVMDSGSDRRNEERFGSDELADTAQMSSSNSETGKSPPQQKDSSDVSEPTFGSNDTQTKNICRRVHFPEGDGIVSERIPPPNPWKSVGDVSTEELVAAYHAACAYNQIKPSIIIIQQLEKMRDLSVRVDSLTFKGEKIDARIAESLEEVFRRVQFTLLDIEGCSLEDEAAVAIFEMVEFYETAVKMSMSSVKGIGFRGWQAASKMMRKSSCLEILDISRTSWSEHSVPILCRALRADTCLVALHLEACNLSGRPLVLLMSALRMNLCIRELFLADNRLMPSDAFHIGGMLKHNAGLKLLDLRNNNMQDVGVNHISDGLAGQMRGQLNTLVLWNNHITHVGAGHLGKTLPMITTLETLNIGQNNFGIEGIMKLKEGLMKNKFLQRMGLFSCRVNDEGAIALAEYLADNCQLIRLDLRENDIRTGGLMALSRSLKLNKVLLRLDLDKSIKKESLNGHAELQRQFLEDIEQLLLANRQYLERNHLQTKITTSDDQPSPQMTSRQVNDPGGTTSNKGVATPSDDPTNSSNQSNGQVDRGQRVSPDGVGGAVLEEELALRLSTDDDSSKAIKDDNGLLGDHSLVRNDTDNGYEGHAGSLAGPESLDGGGTSQGSSTTSIVLDSDTLTVSTGFEEKDEVDVTSIVASDGIQSSTVTLNHNGASSSGAVASSAPITNNSDYASNTPHRGEEPTSSGPQKLQAQGTFSNPPHSSKGNDDGRTGYSTNSLESQDTFTGVATHDVAQSGSGTGGVVGVTRALHRSSPPGIRINENIKLLSHPLNAEQGLDKAGQQLMASAIDDGLPGGSGDDTAMPADGLDEKLSNHLNDLQMTPPLVPLQNSQS